MYINIINDYCKIKNDPLTIKNISKNTHIKKKYIKRILAQNSQLYTEVPPILAGSGKYPKNPKRNILLKYTCES